MTKLFILAQKSLAVRNFKNFRLIRFEKNLKFLRIFLLVAFIFLLIGNVLSINRNIARGYEITKFQEAVASLKEEQKNLQIEIASLKSLQSIEERVRQFDLVPATKITYLAAAKNVAVAKK